MIETRIQMKLQEWRELRGMSRTTLASKAGLDPSAVYLLETGQRKRPHPKTERVLAEALEVAVFDLYSTPGSQEKTEERLNW